MRFSSLRLPINGYPNTTWFAHVVHKYQPVEVRFSAKPTPGGLKYRKIPKLVSPGAYIFQRPFLRVFFWRGLYSEGFIYTERNLHFKIDWASLLVGSKFTGFALFYFVFEAYNIVSRGDLTEGFLRYEFRGLITWRGFFSEFYGDWGPRAVFGLTSVNG